ncbi:hypothetical protein [Shouchella shacheensis]|uniref:hypothetical protein n=1 Tax=Shouchella shacheensis TaxID=1649580 RepID=UPI00074052FB|nr:hypothetical protein [Shouchella shacheensis]
MKQSWIALIVVVLIISTGFIIQVEDEADAEERVIIDFTLNAYSAPSCFDDAGFTNNVSETSLGTAHDSGFEAESVCTTEAFAPEQKPLWLALFS